MLKKQVGNAWIAVIAILVLVAGVVGAIWLNYKNAYSYGNRTEQQLIAIKDNNKNIYAQGTQKVLEIAQVPTMYAEDFKKIVEADIQGRYGKDGSKATVQFIQEHDIRMDGNAIEMYKKIQQTIESFRDKFEVNQTQMIDVTRSYSTALGEDYLLGQGWWLKWAGYPKINLDDFKPITTTRTEKVYEAGLEDAPLKLR